MDSGVPDFENAIRFFNPTPIRVPKSKCNSFKWAKLISVFLHIFSFLAHISAYLSIFTHVAKYSSIFHNFANFQLFKLQNCCNFLETSLPEAAIKKAKFLSFINYRNILLEIWRMRE